MLNIYDFTKYPTSEDWDNIYQPKKEKLDKIELKVENQTFSTVDFKGIELSYWIKEFNNRVFDFVNCYILMMNYYNMGIPDEEWFISPGKNGKGVQYFPHFEDKHYIYLYWFGFYMDTYYSKFFSLYDTVFHLINIKYGFEVDHTLGFLGKVSKKLQIEDNELYEFLEAIRNDDVYKRVAEYRNNMVHNYRPNQIDSGINCKKENGKTIVTMSSIGNYTPTKKFVENISESIDLMATIVDKIRPKILV